MNIIFLTSSMTESDFSSYQSKAKIKPNPSNQNFYNKLIKCLSLKNDVYPLSLRPFCKGMFDEEELPESRSDDGSITYYYPKVSSTRRYKVFNLKNEIIKFFSLKELDLYVWERNRDKFINKTNQQCKVGNL